MPRAACRTVGSLPSKGLDEQRVLLVSEVSASELNSPPAAIRFKAHAGINQLELLLVGKWQIEYIEVDLVDPGVVGSQEELATATHRPLIVEAHFPLELGRKAQTRPDCR